MRMRNPRPVLAVRRCTLDPLSAALKKVPVGKDVVTSAQPALQDLDVFPNVIGSRPRKDLPQRLVARVGPLITEGQVDAPYSPLRRGERLHVRLVKRVDGLS